MLWTQKDTSGMEIRALGFSPQTSNWCHFWLILYFSLPSEGLLLFISSFQSNNLRDFTILFTYGYSAWGSPQLSCFSDICTALSNSIPDLQEKWVPQTSFSPYTQDLFLLLKNPRPLSPSLPVARQTGCPWQHTWACIHFSSLCVCVLSSNAWPEPKANSIWEVSKENPSKTARSWKDLASFAGENCQQGKTRWRHYSDRRSSD